MLGARGWEKRWVGPILVWTQHTKEIRAFTCLEKNSLHLSNFDRGCSTSQSSHYPDLISDQLSKCVRMFPICPWTFGKLSAIQVRFSKWQKVSQMEKMESAVPWTMWLVGTHGNIFRIFENSQIWNCRSNWSAIFHGGSQLLIWNTCPGSFESYWLSEKKVNWETTEMTASVSVWEEKLRAAEWWVWDESIPVLIELQLWKCTLYWF